jgi:ParB-like chromosome segregation protein Spo0J
MSILAHPSPSIVRLPTREISPNPFSLTIYGETVDEIDDLVESVRLHGVLVPLVVTPVDSRWMVVSGHRRLACARRLELPEVPCEVRAIAGDDELQAAVLEYNRQRRKSFSHLMREADALDFILARKARNRRDANLRRGTNLDDSSDCRNSDDRGVRTDSQISQAIGLGGKDLYRQARAIWTKARQGDVRAQNGVQQLDAGTKTIHAAYKDLRRRDRFTPGSSRTRSTISPSPVPWWSTRWRVGGQRSTSASLWDAGAWRMTSDQHGQKFENTT